MKIQYDFNDPLGTRRLKWMKDGLDSIETIRIANQIIEEYSDDGYTLTLRQLYYQFVGRGLLEENTQRAYKNMGVLITRARNNGDLSWDGIEDGGRGVNGIQCVEEDDHEVVSGLERLLSLDFWRRQENYVEVWVEKEALINVIRRACGSLLCPYMPTKGYLSASEAWRAGRRFRDARRQGKNVVMIHLGDHDPEGIDMTRDNTERLEKYSEGSVDVRRISLNMDQVELYDPPPNFAKESSSRYETYVNQFGIEECWELDALEPKVIVELIKQEVEGLIDRDTWKAVRDEQAEKRHHLAKVADNWDQIKDLIDEIDPRDPDDDDDGGWVEDDDGDDEDDGDW